MDKLCMVQIPIFSTLLFSVQFNLVYDFIISHIIGILHNDW